MQILSSLNVKRGSSPSSLRALSAEEIEMVAGGSFSTTVYGNSGGSPSFDWGFFQFYYNNYSDNNNYSDGGSGGGDVGTDPEPAPVEGELSEEQEQGVKDGMDGLKSALEERIAKYGDFKLTLANGVEYKASQLVAGADKVGKAFDLLEGATLANAIANGDADIGAILGFVGGLAGSAAAGAAGAGPLAVFAVGLAVSWGAENGYNAIKTEVIRSVDAWATQMQQNNPDWNNQPSSIQEYIFLQQLFGNPNDGSYPDQGSNAYHHYREWQNNPHYNIP